jgi:hypothetical protein
MPFDRQQLVPILSSDHFYVFDQLPDISFGLIPYPLNTLGTRAVPLGEAQGLLK